MINQRPLPTPKKKKITLELKQLALKYIHLYGICLANTSRIIPREVNGPSFKRAEAPYFRPGFC